MSFRANLLLPFLRDGKRDLAHGSGAVLLASKVRQVLLTNSAGLGGGGELAWRTSFGAGLERLRHRPADETLRELARVAVRDALRRWLPDVELRGVVVEQEGAAVVLRIDVVQGQERAAVMLSL
ncbi:MAG: hypothetical protein IPI49_19825 [Myxococcales bacterium]|nr:hypothetical protein [Myxococcales bacterium]